MARLLSPSIPIRVLRTQSDARLIELARGGHERAFEALVDRYRKPLLGYCRRLLLPEARAEDAIQQSLLQAWLALSDGCEVRDAKAWLYRIVHNAAVSALRRSGYDYVELDESLHGVDAPESDIDRRIAVREVLAGLAALPEAQREVLLRTAVQGHSHEQVAAALDLSDGAVRGLIYRARATLRSAASALMPPQAVLWAARAAETGASHPELAGSAGGATGSAGLFGLLLRGGAVVLSAGVLATGAANVEHGDRGAGTTASGDSARGPSRQTRATSELDARSSSGESARVLALVPNDAAPGHRVLSTPPGKNHHGGRSRSSSDHGTDSEAPFTGAGSNGSGSGSGEDVSSGGGNGESGRGGAGPAGSGGSGDGHHAGRGADGGSGQTSGSSGSSGDRDGSGSSGDGSGQSNDGSGQSGLAGDGEKSGSSGGDGQSPVPAPEPVEAAPAVPLSEATGGSSGDGGSPRPGSSESTDGSSESGSGR
jgi:RNA polymerase sigma factor (sigma-70 family)